MGFITDMRTIKRGLNGDMDRDLEIITGPGVLLFEAEHGSVAKLRQAVARRARYEAQLDGRYLRDLYRTMHDGGEFSRAMLNASDLAGIAVAAGDYIQLRDSCAAIDPNHWLVRELGSSVGVG
jgi:hypothetical protein